ncbi:MAG TPA: hypothetical protein VF097_05005 [Actinomycetota bacterium]
MSASACSVHPDVPARETCGRCGRAACLGCAVPVRGEVRCMDCVGEELGEPIEAAPPPRSVRFRDLPAGLLFLAAVLVSLLPWDRQGSHAGFLSAWTPVPEPWPFVAGVLLLLATVASLRGRQGRLRAVHIALGALAVLATILALPAPELSTRGPVPIVVLGLAVAATLTGAVRATAAFWQRP